MEIDVAELHITGGGMLLELKEVSRLPLKVMSITNAQLTVHGLSGLKKLPDLTVLHLNMDIMIHSNLLRVIGSIDQLHELKITDCSLQIDNSLSELVT